MVVDNICIVWFKVRTEEVESVVCQEDDGNEARLYISLPTRCSILTGVLHFPLFLDPGLNSPGPLVIATEIKDALVRSNRNRYR